MARHTLKILQHLGCYASKVNSVLYMLLALEKILFLVGLKRHTLVNTESFKIEYNNTNLNSEISIVTP